MTTQPLTAGLVLIIEGDRYTLAVSPTDFALAKEGGGVTYGVTFDAAGQPQCECSGFEFRHAPNRKRFRDSCRHIEALKAVNLIAPRSTP